MIGGIVQPSPAFAPPGRMRLARLDGLRGLAALGVFLHHMAFFCGDGAVDLPMVLGWPVNWIIARGWVLVDLFFVLSGYVFAHAYGAPGQLRAPGAMAKFWVARIARLWPLHLATLALFALIGWGRGNDLWHFTLNVLMLQGFDLKAPFSFNLVSWSLSAEMLAYALFACAARIGDRALFRLSVLAVLANACWLAQGSYLGGPWHGEVIARGLLGFFTGQLLWRGRENAARLPAVFLVAMLAGGLFLGRDEGSPFLPLGLLSWPAAVLLALRMPWLEGGAMAWLGARSFGIYMVHLLVIRTFNALWPSQGMGLADLVLSHGAIILLTLACAEGAYRLIEVPARAAIRGCWAVPRPKDKAISAQLA
jgi:peptidoglycan/LPS O-acetylase OafA/YrhL